MKTCSKCGELKEISDFPGKKIKKSWCRECSYKAKEIWYAKNINAKHKHHIKYTFGITEEDYNNMLAAQHGVCAICSKSETALDNKGNNTRKLNIDHDHITGKIRGLLCSKCNTALGLFNDSKENIIKALEYLIKTE